MKRDQDETKTRLLVEEGTPISPAEPVVAPRPTLGRIVLYRSGAAEGRFADTSNPPEDHPAIVTGINPDGSIALHVFYRTGGFDMPVVYEAEEARGESDWRGKWRWPPRA